MGKINFYYPNPKTFPSVSVSGSGCELDCAHCGRHYLESMIPVEEFVPGPETKGCLISGGCDLEGRVELPFDRLSELKNQGLILNVHTGLVNEETARKLSGLVDCVSIDVVGDKEIVKKVYGIDKGIEDYRECLELLKNYKIRFTPHVCLGLNGGGYSGEDHAFDLIGEFSERVTLLILMPTEGTKFAGVEIDQEHVLKMIDAARNKFSRVDMGCMRPRIRRIEEELVKLNGVVRPSKWTKDAVAREGLEVVESEVCCACK